MKLSSVVLVGALVVASTASADTKSWTALKGKVPASTSIVGSVDAAALRATPSFPKVLDFLRGTDKDVGPLLDLVKATCGMELPAMIGDFAFALDVNTGGVVVFSLAGTDQTKITDCATKLVSKLDPQVKLSAKVTGKITEYAIGPDGKFFAAWLAPDLVAIAIDEKSAGPLDAMFAGGAVSGDLAKFLGKTSTSATGWLAAAPKDDDLAGVSATLALGKTVTVAIRATATTPKAGDKGRKEAKDAQKKGLERSAKQPELKKVFQAMKVGGRGTEITVDMSMPEASIPAVLPALDKVF